LTDLQIKYQQLQLERNRVQEELELNKRAVSETERHNLATEQAAKDQLAVSWHQAYTARQNADTNRMNYGVNLLNAETNRLNYGVNAKNAETNRLNYGVNAMNAETNRLNYGVNAMNAQTNARNAAVNERNAAVNERNAATNEYNAYVNRLNYGVNLAKSRAEIDYMKAQTADVQAKTASQYWEATTQRERASALSYLTGGVVSGAKSAISAVKNATSPSPTSVNLGGRSGGSFGSGNKTITTNPLLPGASSAVGYMVDVFPFAMFDHWEGRASLLEDLILYLKTGKHYNELTLEEGREYFGKSWKTTDFMAGFHLSEEELRQLAIEEKDNKKR
jgi:uncharacterized phage infection (PIP) family protein YhgE